jgi:hypothetical protein
MSHDYSNVLYVMDFAGDNVIVCDVMASVRIARFLARIPSHAVRRLRLEFLRFGIAPGFGVDRRLKAR